MSDKIKKLSQAIRLGATFRPKAVGRAFTFGPSPAASCALGAAFEALHPGEPERLKGVTTTEIKFMLHKRFGLSQSVCDLVIHKNDAELWTRELIAQWLEEAHGL